MLVQAFHEAVSRVCPVHGVSLGRSDDKTTWRIDFRDDATEEQKTAAAAVLAAIDPAKETLRSCLAVKAWAVETGGIERMLGDVRVTIPTDDRAKTLLMGAAIGLADDAKAPFISPSATVFLTGVQFKQVYAAVAQHVQAVFAVRADLLARIESGEITTAEQIDGAKWPA